MSSESFCRTLTLSLYIYYLKFSSYDTGFSSGGQGCRFFRFRGTESFVANAFFPWGHDENISLLLLRLGFVFRMKYFSAMHRLHLFVAAEYGCALSITSHDKWYSAFDSLSFHTNSLKVVVGFFVVKAKARYMLVVSGLELIFLLFLCKYAVFFSRIPVRQLPCIPLAFGGTDLSAGRIFYPCSCKSFLFFFYLCRFKYSFVVARKYLFHILHAVIA